MRRYQVARLQDETGVSGTGHIADAVEFDDGTLVMRWRTEAKSTAVYASLDEAVRIHGHEGKTRFIPLDDPPPLVAMCIRCFASQDVIPNYCFTCGAGGCGLVMSKEQMKMIQEHDYMRLKDLQKRDAELRPLRRLAFDVFGPLTLDVSIAKSGVRCGEVTYCETQRPDEDDTAFAERVVERCAFDVERLQRAIQKRMGA